MTRQSMNPFMRLFTHHNLSPSTTGTGQLEESPFSLRSGGFFHLVTLFQCVLFLIWMTLLLVVVEGAPQEATPVALTAFAQTTNSVILDWTRSTGPGVTSQRMYQSMGGLSFVEIATLPPTESTLVVPNLVEGTSYQWRVTASNAAGEESVPSNVVGYIVPGIPVPPVTNRVYLWMEAELGTITSPMIVKSDALASGGKYVESMSANAGNVSLTLVLPKAGQYMVWTRTISPDASHDSLWFSLNGASEIAYGTMRGKQGPSWGYSAVTVNDSTSQTPLVYNLSAGTNRFQFRQRELGTRLDLIVVTDDLAFVPSGVIPPVVTTNTPPTLSGTAGRTVSWVKSWPVTTFTVTVGDNQTPLGNLVVTATSSNQALVPASGLVWTGAGATRMLSVVPVSGQSGATTITITVSDGSLSKSDSFVLTVPQ